MESGFGWRVGVEGLLLGVLVLVWNRGSDVDQVDWMYLTEAESH
jgi:hypothetical protein